MYRYLPNWSLLPLLCAGALIAGPTPVWVGEPAGSDDWQYAATIYLWGAAIKGETVRGADVNVNFDTLINNLNMAFMGTFEARKSRWSFLTDVSYLNVGANGSGRVPVALAPDTGVGVSANVKTKGWVLDFIGGYNLWNAPQASLDVIAGARRLDFGLGVDAGPYAAGRDLSRCGSVWDGVIGVKGQVELNPKWYVPYCLDVGTGQSDLTWQSSGGLACRFRWGVQRAVI
jgi:hypothetical protein